MSDEDSNPSKRLRRRKKKNTEARSPNLFVTNIPDALADSELEEYFSSVGSVRMAKVMIDPRTLKTLGHGFVLMSDSQEAMQALRTLNGSRLRGARLGVTTSERDYSHLLAPLLHLYMRRLPKELTGEELLAMCSQFGKAESVIWGRAQPDEDQTTQAAIVSFADAESARKAEKGIHRHTFSFNCGREVTLIAKRGEPPADRSRRVQDGHAVPGALPINSTPAPQPILFSHHHQHHQHHHHHHQQQPYHIQGQQHQQPFLIAPQPHFHHHPHQFQQTAPQVIQPHPQVVQILPAQHQHNQHFHHHQPPQNVPFLGHQPHTHHQQPILVFSPTQFVPPPSYSTPVEYRLANQGSGGPEQQQ